ncbi:hypothetical protein EX227_02810 [Providencia rettgeri]|uniref:Uncharacterized protein n=1 Tax=Providencia rettgeri TaxID=587 RepID=A0AAP2JWZ8_PRORE|nr:hypothetical protein [Providencia rettgeri]MBX6952727.1 hypothetical protein [Providencia rettgeri]MBX6956718.1 hypothetical protein [Providencia rettgeri]MBX6960492.1 hypothetical protein [Providencia rettgeri]MBX6970653.1 hypothetical protein [Providencia rettgeri]MBX6980111.1 hypothetical protein [Providencia rettgeri]
MSGIFEVTTSEDMFHHFSAKYQLFISAPSTSTLLDVLFPCSHLKEWIEKDGQKNERTELTLQQLDDSAEYKVIRSMCNNTKHFYKKSAPETKIISGARAGIARAGDSLGQDYFLVDEVDIRNHLSAVYEIYMRHFKG